MGPAITILLMSTGAEGTPTTAPGRLHTEWARTTGPTRAPTAWAALRMDLMERRYRQPGTTPRLEDMGMRRAHRGGTAEGLQPADITHRPGPARRRCKAVMPTHNGGVPPQYEE